MPLNLPSLAELEDAAKVVYAAMPPTPQYRWPLLCGRLGTEVWVKHENHTPIGAFKLRGGLTYFHELLTAGAKVPGVISATRGNHGQSVGYAARAHGIAATIVAPRGNSVEKNAAMRAFGVELLEHGADFQQAREFAQHLASEHGLHLVPSFHRNLVLGVASYGLELFRAVPDLNVVYVPIGLGSGICALIAARNALGCKADIVGVVSAQAPAYALSFEQRRAVEAPVTTRLADGMACRVPEEAALEVIWRGASDVVRVSDSEVAQAMLLYFTATHNVAEGAGAAALAAALKQRAKLQSKKVALVISGGNVDHDVFARVLAGAVS